MLRKLAVILAAIALPLALAVPAGAAPAEYNYDFFLDCGNAGLTYCYAYNNGHNVQVTTAAYSPGGVEDLAKTTYNCSQCTGGWVEMVFEDGLCLQAYNNVVRPESCNGATYEQWLWKQVSGFTGGQSYLNGGYVIENRHDGHALTAGANSPGSGIVTAGGSAGPLNIWGWFYG